MTGVPDLNPLLLFIVLYVAAQLAIVAWCLIGAWRDRRKRNSRITIGSNPEPFTIIDKTDSTLTVDRHDPNLKDGDIIVPYEGRW